MFKQDVLDIGLAKRVKFFDLDGKIHKLVNASNFYTGRYDFNYIFIEYGKNFSDSRNTKIPLTLRYSQNTKNIQQLKSTHNRLDFSYIRKIANITEKKFHVTKKTADKYLRSLKKIFCNLQEKFDWMNSELFIVPLIGGAVVTYLFDIPSEKVLKLDCKRIPLEKDGHYSFGLNTESGISAKYADDLLQKAHNSSLTILEICVGSGITTVSLLVTLYKKNIRPKKITILATVMAQQGYEKTMLVANKLGFEVEFIVGKIVYRLNDHYKFPYDPVVYDNGDLVIKSPHDFYKVLYNTDI